MKVAFTVVGAAVLVLGASLIAFAPFYVQTGFYTAELKSVQAFTSPGNASTVASLYASYADTGNLISLAGVILAPVGAAILAYGVSKGRSEAKQVASPAEPMQA